MAGESGPQNDPVMRRIADAPYRYDFFAAVRRIECAHLDLPRLGRSIRAAQDPVRFGQEPSLAFAPSTVGGVEWGPGTGVPRMLVNFFGLLGPNGPMPLFLTEYVRGRERNASDPTLARFLDVFHHRMTSFFYRSWAASRIAVSHDRRDDDRWGGFVGSLFGLGAPSLRDRDAVPDLAKLHYAGRLASGPKHPEGLAGIVGDYFGMPAEIREFVGHWMELPAEYRCRLGASRATGLLGQTAIVGSRVWDCQQTFRLRLGAMGLAAYTRMLPRGPSFRRLIDWIRNYIGDELTWEVQLVLRKDEVPPVQLGRLGQLGWTTWLQSQPFSRDADDLVLRPPAA